MAIEKVVGKIKGLSDGAEKVLKGAADGWKAGYRSMSREERDMYWMGLGVTGAGIGIGEMSKNR